MTYEQATNQIRLLAYREAELTESEAVYMMDLMDAVCNFPEKLPMEALTAMRAGTERLSKIMHSDYGSKYMSKIGALLQKMSAKNRRDMNY